MSSDVSPGPPAPAVQTQAPQEEPPYRWRWFAFAVVLTASVMDVLDALVTTVAGPSIRADVGGSTTVIQWLSAGYTLAMAAGLIIGGRLGDIYGRKRMFMIGVTGFTICSALCGLAEGSGSLIVYRVLQGLFGAVLIPQGLGLIKDMFPVRELPLAFGSIGPVMGMATIAGPLLGGWLIAADFFGSGWRMIFLINLPIGVLALAAAAKVLPRSAERTASRLDLPGAAIVSVAAVLMVFPVVQGRELGWPVWTFVSMAAAVALFVVFGRYESFRQRAGGDCLVIPALFRKRAFSGTLAVGALLFSAIVGSSLVLTLYIQIGLGHSPLRAALYGLPQVLGSSVIALIAGRMGLAVKLGRKLIHIGTAMLFAGTAALFGTMVAAGHDVNPLWFGPSLAVVGVGMGLAMSALYFTVNTAAEPHESGSASGTFTAVQQFSGALGVAVLGTVFFGLLGGQVASQSDEVAVGLRDRLTAAAVSSGDQDRIVAGARACGEARATNEDPAHLPASCAALDRTVESVPATGAQQDRIDAAAREATGAMSERGFDGAFRGVLLFLAALYTISFGLTFLLPRARPGFGSAPGGAPEPAEA